MFWTVLLRLSDYFLDLLTCGGYGDRGDRGDRGDEHVAHQELPRAYCDVLNHEAEQVLDASHL